MKIDEIKPNTAVFTTRFVVESSSPILYVTHDSDGDWHFMGDDDADEEDAKLVSIKNILDLDYSINNLPSLDQGFRAVRLRIKDSWDIFKIEE